MKNCRGLGLLEVLIGITVAAVAGLLLINLLVSSNSIFFNQTIKVEHGLSLNQAAYELTRLIRSSLSLASQYPATGSPEFTSGAHVLILKLPALSQNGQIIDSVFDYAVISADPTNPKILRKQVFTNAQSSRDSENKVLTTSLNSIDFTYLDINNNQVAIIDAVRVGFTIDLSQNSGMSDKESNISGTVNLKNI